MNRFLTLALVRTKKAATLALSVAAFATIASFARTSSAAELSQDDAIHLALQRNRDVIAAKLEIEAAELDRVAARVYPNPILSYTAGNVVLGRANPQPPADVSPSPFGQLVQTVGVSEIVDVWAKRSAHIKAADRGIEHQRLVVEDALREIVHSVRSGYADLVREQLEHDLTRATKERYDETIRISGARFHAGEISEAEFRKIELEGLRYQNALIDADLELDQARQALARLIGIPPTESLSAHVPENGARTPYPVQAVVKRALDERPDVRAAKTGITLAEAAMIAAKRDAYPDISLGVAYTHSNFEVSGDNPNALALTLSLPVPLFDRNQANIGRAQLDSKRYVNDVARLELQVQHEVTDAIRRAERSSRLLDVYEGGGMLDRASKALKAAESSYNAGSSSLVELLEAQRTYIDTRSQYLRAQHEYRQAVIDVTYATGEKVEKSR